MSTTTSPSKTNAPNANACDTAGAWAPPPNPTRNVAMRLAELVNAGKNLDAFRELYADNARHIEAMAMPGCPMITEGKAALVEKAEKFARTSTIYSQSCSKPSINGDQFACTMTMDCMCTEGPMANQRMNMSETAIYTVKNDKITEAKFFYGCPV